MNNPFNGTPTRLTATGTICQGGTRLIGFYVSSTTGGTVVLRQGGSGGAQISGTITPAIGWHFFPASVSNLHATIANTLDVTFIHAPDGSG